VLVFNVVSGKLIFKYERVKLDSENSDGNCSPSDADRKPDQADK
jgi:hypothetical protein